MVNGRLRRYLSMFNLLGKPKAVLPSPAFSGSRWCNNYHSGGIRGRMHLEPVSALGHLELFPFASQLVGTDLACIFHSLVSFMYPRMFLLLSYQGSDPSPSNAYPTRRIKKSKTASATKRRGSSHFYLICFSICPTTRSATCPILSAITVQPDARTCPPPPK